MQHDHDPASVPSDNDLHPVLTPPSPAHAGRKRKVPSTSSRGVASLTPEQLAKKRANDREAQRAIRERTKLQIESLERRIQDLTSQQPYQELQEALRQKDAIQAENNDIRRTLASIVAIIQPILGAQGLTDLATAAQHNVRPSGPGHQNPAFHSGQGPQPDPTAYFNGPSNARAAFSNSPGMTQGQIENTAFAPAVGGDTAEENRVWTASRDALHLQRDNLQRGLELDEGGERLSFNFLLDSLGQRPGGNGAVAPGAHSSPPQQHPHQQPPPLSSPGRGSAYPSLPPSLTDPTQHPSPWTMLPNYVAPTCPLDGLLINFIHSRRRENIGPDSHTPSQPSVGSLLNPAGNATTRRPIDPLSQFMTDIISKFPNISELPDQTATLFIMFLQMRWLIHPTQENYERLPDWMRPTTAQLVTPHPAWIDHIPWPAMRDRVIAHHHDYPFENWFIPFTSDLCVNWPYDAIDCLLSTPDKDKDKDDPVINPVFERHLRRLENWSVGPLFAETYPALADTATIKARNGPAGHPPRGTLKAAAAAGLAKRGKS